VKGRGSIEIEIVRILSMYSAYTGKNSMESVCAEGDNINKLFAHA
jgi:hypothetical protein